MRARCFPRAPACAAMTLTIQSKSETSTNLTERFYNYKLMCLRLTNAHLPLKPLILLNIGQLLDISLHRM